MAGWPVIRLINIWKISLHCLCIFIYGWWMLSLQGHFADGNCSAHLQVFYYRSKSVKHLFEKRKKKNPPPYYWTVKCHQQYICCIGPISEHRSPSTSLRQYVQIILWTLVCAKNASDDIYHCSLTQTLAIIIFYWHMFCVEIKRLSSCISFIYITGGKIKWNKRNQAFIFLPFWCRGAPLVNTYNLTASGQAPHPPPPP